MIDVRQASEGDAEVLANLNRYVHELHVNHAPQLFKLVDTTAVSEWFRSMLAKPSVGAWIAESEGSPAGYVLAIVYDRPEHSFCFRRVFYEIDQIAVSPGHRRMGVARELVARVLADAHSRGIRDVELNSWSFNVDAHEAFRALGFRPQMVRFARAVL